MLRSILILSILCPPASLLGQGLTSSPPRPDDVATLDGIVSAFYDVISAAAGERVDWARDSTLYLDGARFTIIGGADSVWRANRVDHATYAADSDAFLSQGFFEREIHRETHRFGPMAQVFSTYEWRRAPEAPPEGRGINSMQLFHDGDRWWIVGVMWTSEGPGLPIPEAFLPPGGRPGVLELDDVRAVASIPWHDVSPDGRQVAYLFDESGEGEPDLWLRPTARGAAERIPLASRVRIPVGWSRGGETLAFLGEDGEDGGDRLRVWTVAPGGAAVPSCRVPGSARSAAWAGPDRISFAARGGEPSGAPPSPARVSNEPPPGEAVFVCDLASGTVERATAESYHGLEFDWSPDGSRLAISAQREPGFYGAIETDLYLVDPATGVASGLVARPGVDRAPAWSPDGSHVAFVTGFGRSGLLPNLGIAAVTADGSRVLDIGRDHDRGGFFEGPTIVGWSEDGRSIYYSVVDRVRVPLFRVGLAGGPPERISTPWEEEGSTYGYDLSADGETVVFKRSTTGRPPEMFASRAGSVLALTSVNAPLAPLGVPDAEVVRWTASDGTEVEGLLMRPIEGRGSAPYPLVTILHGGPASAYTLGFPGLAFFNPYQDMLLAARGYAVFLPNPRGSGGYGQAFRDAARGDWGDGPTDDVLSGIDHLVELGVADPERLALAGWSYGGYLAAWLLTRTDRFVVASVGAGVVDLAAHHGQSAEQMEEYFGGPPWARSDLYRRQSPMTWVDRITTPTMLFHGTDDTSVSPAQSEQMHAALMSLGVPTALVRYPGEGHSLRRPAAQDDAWRRFYDWLREWLPPGSP